MSITPVQIDVRTSGIWQLNSVVISSAGACVIVDPAYFPRELAELVDVVKKRGYAEKVLFTHGHWDHIVGWSCFPDATFIGSPALQQAILDNGPVAQRNLQEAQDFDARWYVERKPSLHWPPSLQAAPEGTLPWAGATPIYVLHLPGHSIDGLGLWIEEPKTLLVGDYLSPCEIPFVDHLPSYMATLQRLQGFVQQANCVIPGHGPLLSAAQAQNVLQEDVRYLETLWEYGQLNEWNKALALSLPRAQRVPGMAEAHLENCRRLGLPQDALHPLGKPSPSESTAPSIP